MMTKTQLNNRKTLIQALRSGKYQQAKGYLRTPTGFCCQGVACDLFQEKVGGKWDKNFDEYDSYISFILPEHDGAWEEDFATLVWHSDIRELVGFTKEDSNQLASMNDGIRANYNSVIPYTFYTLGEPCTFEEIADCMEFLTLAGL